MGSRRPLTLHRTLTQKSATLFWGLSISPLWDLGSWLLYRTIGFDQLYGSIYFLRGFHGFNWVNKHHFLDNFTENSTLKIFSEFNRFRALEHHLYTSHFFQKISEERYNILLLLLIFNSTIAFIVWEICLNEIFIRKVAACHKLQNEVFQVHKIVAPCYILGNSNK